MRDGGPVFPFPTSSGIDNDDVTWFEHDGTAGLSLRDYFAAAALTVFADPDAFSACESGADFHAVSAKWAYAQADAMLAEREKGGEG